MKGKDLILAICLMCFVIAHDEDIFLGEKHKPGFVKLKNRDEMFYWMFYSRRDRNSDPLMIYLQGGPGWSSLLSTFVQNGPFHINDDLTLRTNPYSWNNNANLLYVDQPVGVGFSSVFAQIHYTTSEYGVARDFYIFLEQFVKANPEFKGRDLYFGGVSYAGHYIPAIVSYYLKQKKQSFNLKGIAIGNGWTDPITQYASYPVFSLENELIDKQAFQEIENNEKYCKSSIEHDPSSYSYDFCQMINGVIVGFPPRFNPFDIRLRCSFPDTCYDFSPVAKFLAREDVRAVLGVGDRVWQLNDKLVQGNMKPDITIDLAPKVAEILNSNVEVLIYNGDKDWICNWRGGEAWTNDLDFHGSEKFRNAGYSAWFVDGVESGQVKSANGLTFLRVYDAGHFAPKDQPKNALSMLSDFLYK